MHQDEIDGFDKLIHTIEYLATCVAKVYDVQMTLLGVQDMDSAELLEFIHTKKHRLLSELSQEELDMFNGEFLEWQRKQHEEDE